MKTSISIVLLALVGCTGDGADIGENSNPVTCMPNAFADVSGAITDPSTQTHYTFDTATPSATGQQATTLSLQGEALLLRFGFYCGAAQQAKYGVKGDTQQGLECPLEVASTILGRIEYLPAKSGTMIVDEN